jgi:hypothetical protein
MATASSSLSQLGYIEESTFGVTPGAGNYKQLRMTGESLALNISKDSSKEMDSSRQIRSLVTTKADVNGGINLELSYKEYDDLLAAGLQTNWVVYGTNGLSAAANATWTSGAGTTRINFAAAPTGNDALTNIQVGQWVRIIDQGTTALASNVGYFRVTGVNANYLQVADSLFTVDATAKSVKIATSRVKVGSTRRSFSIERQHADVGQYFVYKGMVVNKFDLKFSAGAITSGGIDFIGTTSLRGVATALPGTATASQTFTSMNGITGVSQVNLDNAALATYTGAVMKDLSFTVDNKLQGLEGIGVLGNADIMSGTCEVMGSFSVYLSNGALYDDFINAVQHSFSFVTKDPQGNAYAITFPKIELKNIKSNASAKDQPVMLDAEFQAIYDGVTSIYIDRM